MKFDSAQLLAELNTLEQPMALVVALSGGLDSMVLLHALCGLRDEGRLQRPLRALHINHQLSPHADRWQRFCEDRCRALLVPLECQRAELAADQGLSPEERARNARYACFEAALGEQQCLVMAHHLDDQMETLLLRLNRGAGPGGLAGIPRQRRLGAGSLLRPLLQTPRAALQDYARSAGLPWIEDESNERTEFDRNFWRQEILPVIKRRFPGFQRSWQTAMTLCGEADGLLEELALGDLSGALTDDARIINASAVRLLSEPRQRNLLRYWMRSQGFQPPGRQSIQRLSREILVSDRFGARLDCAAGSVQRFGEQLVLLRSLPLARDWRGWWHPEQEATLALADNGRLQAGTVRPGQENRIGRLGLTGKPLVVRYLPGGTAVRLAGRPTRTLKKIIQDSSRLPWLRDRQPVVCLGESVICVPGIGVADGFQAATADPGLAVDWVAPDLLFQQTGNG